MRRWMAPESFLNGTYSIKSDVFSYGVVIYEIATQREPWSAFSNVSVIAKVTSGISSGMFIRSPEVLQTLMTLYVKSKFVKILRCWKQEPKDRPDFSKIVQLLSPSTSKDSRAPIPNFHEPELR